MKRGTFLLAALGIVAVVAITWRVFDINTCSRDGGVRVGGISQQAYCAHSVGVQP
jgi:hypothetical protein